jgi:pimeloyl-[acyl-carrier protein] synthase
MGVHAMSQAQDDGLRVAAEPDPFDPAIHPDPYPTYRRLRELDPVHWSLPHGVWFLTRHADCDALLRDRRFSAERERTLQAGRAGARNRPVYRSMLFLDPPDHTRLRTLVSKAFTPRMVEALRPRIRSIAAELLDRAAATDEFDLVSAFAYPLPVTVIAEMLGVPVEDHARFQEWSAILAQNLDPMDATATADADQVHDARAALFAYLGAIVEQRRREPRDDLITALVAVEERGDVLSLTELLMMCNLLLIAGHETTVNLIGNGVLALLQHPDRLERLRAQPDLAPSAIEELLRYASPVQFTARVALEDVRIDGHPIRAGQPVVAMLAAANRDPAVFADPDRLDLERDPNPHLAFGRGIHHCLGAPLARLEGQIAISLLLERFPRLRLAGEPVLRPNLVLRGLERLPVATA